MAYRKLRPKPGKCINCPPCINPGDMLKQGLEHCYECCKDTMGEVSTQTGSKANQTTKGVDKPT